jgi:hypothetical protein
VPIPGRAEGLQLELALGRLASDRSFLGKGA